MHRKWLFENFFDDIDDIQVNDDETKVPQKLDFSDSRWPVFICLYIDFDAYDENTSNTNLDKITKFIKYRLDASRIIEDYGDIYITDNEHLIGNENIINCLTSEFNNRWEMFKEYCGFHLCVGVVPNKRGNIIQAHQLICGLLNQTEQFLKNILHSDLNAG